MSSRDAARGAVLIGHVYAWDAALVRAAIADVRTSGAAAPGSRRARILDNARRGAEARAELERDVEALRRRPSRG